MIEPSDDILCENEAIYGDDFRYLEMKIKEYGPFVTVDLKDLPSLDGKPVNREKRLTLPTTYEPIKPYFFSQSGLSLTFIATPAELSQSLMTDQRDEVLDFVDNPVIFTPTERIF